MSVLMNPTGHLEDNLRNCARYSFSGQEEADLKQFGLKEYLFKQITRKTFRRWKLPDLARARINRVLDYCINNHTPIIFRFRFGGYKLWRLESSPEVDWAEFFTFAHYSRYLAPIIAAHEPGARLVFMSDDAFVEQMNNVPLSNTHAYYVSFLHLCDEFGKYAPGTFKIEMIRHADLYNSPDDLKREFAIKLAEIEGTWREKQSPEKLQSALDRSSMNIKWDGVRNLTQLSEEEKGQFIEKSAIMHDALLQLPTIRAYADNNPSMIYVFTTPIPSLVAIGTSRVSVVKFWIGTGVLECRDGIFLDHILSPKQLDRIRQLPSRQIPSNLIPLRNFQTVRVYEDRLAFTK